MSLFSPPPTPKKKRHRRATSSDGFGPAVTPATYAGFNGSGVFHYRTRIPQQAIGARLIEWDRDGHTVREDGIDKVLHVNGPVGAKRQNIINLCREQGRRIVVDVDDWLRAVVDNPAHHYADIYTPEIIEAFEKTVAEADRITVSTPELQKVIATELGRESVVIPNVVDAGRFKGHKRLFPTHSVIGASLGTGHREAFTPWIDPLSDVLRETGSILLLVGSDYRALFPEDVRSKIIFSAWLEIEHLAEVQSSFDVMLAPTLDTDFYKQKSDIRVLESWAAGAVPVVGPDGPYAKLVNSGTNGYVCNDVENVYDAIKTAVEDKYIRRRLVTAGQKWLYANRTPSQMTQRWKDSVTF